MMIQIPRWLIGWLSGGLMIIGGVSLIGDLTATQVVGVIAVQIGSVVAFHALGDAHDD